VRHLEIGEIAMPGREDQCRLGILDEPGQLGRCVGGVERNIDEPGAKAREIEQGDLDRLLRLDEDAVAGPGAKSDKRRGIAANRAVKIGVGQADFTAFNEKRRPSGKGRRFLEQAVEVGAQSAAFSASTRSVFSQLNRSPSGLRPKWP
jgi:hypothetical protein